jgi:hypothetical protein
MVGTQSRSGFPPLRSVAEIIAQAPERDERRELCVGEKFEVIRAIANKASRLLKMGQAIWLEVSC